MLILAAFHGACAALNIIGAFSFANNVRFWRNRADELSIDHPSIRAIMQPTAIESASRNVRWVWFSLGFALFNAAAMLWNLSRI